MTSSASCFRGDARRFDIFVDLPRFGAQVDCQTEEQLSQRLRELLPGRLNPDQVCFKRQMVFLNYFAQSRADDALTTLRRVISFDTTAPIDLALRASRPTPPTISPTNGANTLCFFNVERVAADALRATIQRLLGSDNLLLPVELHNAVTEKRDNAFLQFHSREALERALRIFGQIPADATDPAERALRGARISGQTLQAFGMLPGYRGDVRKVCHDFLVGRCDYPHCKFVHPDVGGGGGGEGFGPPPAAPRFRMYRCELCRYELDEREFPPSEIAEHAQAPRCARCCERREAEKRREWEAEQRRAEEQRREEERRVYGDASAGGGAAAYHHPPPAHLPPPPAHQQFYQYHAEQQQQHDRVGQRRGREDYGDDGFPTRPRGSW